MKKQLGMTTAMAATLLGTPGCSSGNEWNEDVVAERDTQVCLDSSNVRVDDDLCNDRYHSYYGGYHGYYFGRGARLPYYGESVDDPRFRNTGSATPRSGATYDRAPVATRMTRSQAVARGGLGSSGRGFGGGRS